MDPPVGWTLGHRLRRSLSRRRVGRVFRRVYLPLILIIYTLLGTYIAANIVPFNVPVLNPPEPPTDQAFGLFYPAFTGAIGNMPGGQIFVDVLLHADTSPIFDNEKVLVTATGSGYPPLNSSISIKVVLEGSVPYVSPPSPGITISPPAFGGVLLRPSNTCPNPRVGYGPPYFCGESQWVYWPLPGSYFPSLAVELSNGTITTEHLMDFRVAVYPADVLGTRQYNKITIALTVALTIFGFVEGLKTMTSLSRRRT